MLTVLSPAKTLEFDTPPPVGAYTQPVFLSEAEKLVETLRKRGPQELAALMNIRPALAELNHRRFREWHPRFDLDNAKQAIFAFRGDVYRGFRANELSDEDLRYAHEHLAILSGLYGLLRPLDLMQPYRLEMGTKLANPRGENLYQFWGDLLTDTVNTVLETHEQRVLVNLASNEYFSALKPKRIAGTIITPAFKDWKNGRLRTLAIYAKLARGSMARWIIEQRIEQPQQLTEFNQEGYRYAPEHSQDGRPVFVREPE